MLTLGECILVQLVVVAFLLVIMIPFLSFNRCGQPGRTRFAIPYSNSLWLSHLICLQQGCQGKGVTIYKVVIPIESEAFVNWRLYCCSIQDGGHWAMVHGRGGWTEHTFPKLDVVGVDGLQYELLILLHDVVPVVGKPKVTVQVGCEEHLLI